MSTLIGCTPISLVRTPLKTLITIMIMPIALISCQNQKSDDDVAKFLSSGKWIDLSYSFNSKTVYWPNNPTGFKLDTQVNGITPTGYYYSSNAFSAPEHGGTHLDAP